MLYNLVAFGLALSGVSGFKTTDLRVAAHPLLYPVTLLSRSWYRVRVEGGPLTCRPVSRDDKPTPFVVAVSVPAELHLIVGITEYAAIVSTAYVVARVTGIRPYKFRLVSASAVLNRRLEIFISCII